MSCQASLPRLHILQLKMNLNNELVATGDAEHDEMVAALNGVFRLILDLAYARDEPVMLSAPRSRLTWGADGSMAWPISRQQPVDRRVWDGSTREREDRHNRRDLVRLCLGWDRRMNQLVFSGLRDNAISDHIALVQSRDTTALVGISDASRYGGGTMMLFTDNNSLADGMSRSHPFSFDGFDHDENESGDGEMPELVD